MKTKIVVTKLGGTSLNTAQKIISSVNSVIADGNCRHIVVSAPGSVDGGEKITDQLNYLYDLVENKLEWKECLDSIMQIFNQISLGLGISINYPNSFFVSDLIYTIEQKNPSRDDILRLGEYLQTHLVVIWLQNQGHEALFVDPMKCIFFKKGGSVNYRKTYSMIKFFCSGPELFIIPGFYGCSYDGKVKTFPRDGSDITGALVAAGLKADLYQMGKDVPGFCTADPRYVANPEVISEMTHRKARALTYASPKVIHPDTLKPLIDRGIPVRIFDPNKNENGTLISPKLLDEQAKPLGIAGKSNFVLFRVIKDFMNNEVGILDDILGIFKNLKISIEHSPTSIDSIHVLIDLEKCSYSDDLKNQIIKEIKKVIKTGQVEVLENISVLVFVTNIPHKGFVSRITSALEDENIEIYTKQDVGDGQYTISIDSSNLKLATRVAYSELFEKKNSFYTFNYS